MIEDCLFIARTKEESKEIQRLLFKLDCSWYNGRRIIPTDKYIFVSKGIIYTNEVPDWNMTLRALEWLKEYAEPIELVESSSGTIKITKTCVMFKDTIIPIDEWGYLTEKISRAIKWNSQQGIKK